MKEHKLLAQEMIKFTVGIDQGGFNIFVLGSLGLGKHPGGLIV